jgi:nucleotide-binding universal stress UspA family protein
MAEIIVPYDFSENAQIALDQALMIATKNSKSLEVLHITNKAICRDYPHSWDCNEKSTEKLQKKLEVIVEDRKEALLLATKVTTSVSIKEDALISAGITTHMLQSDAKLLVMGTHGSTGLYDKLFGSNTAVMANHALFPVLMVPPHWKPISIEHCIAAIKLSKLQARAKIIMEWSRFFECSVEAVQFSILPESEADYATKTSIGEVPCRMIKNDIETPLVDDLLQFARPLQKTVLLLFTHNKTFFEKLFTPNLTYKLSGTLTIPLLSLPIEDNAEQ